MKNYFIIVLIFSFTINHAQKSNEQVALDYFFENILKTEYENVKLKFSGSTEPVLTGTFSISECINQDEFKEMNLNGFKEASSIKLNDIFVKKANKLCGKGKKARITLKVYREININRNSFVLVSLNEKNIRTIHFFIKINTEQKVNGWCKTYLLN